MRKNNQKTEKKEHADVLKQETDVIYGKIDAAFEKLAKKFRAKADRAKDEMDGARHKTKRAIQLRRFELYADAANRLEDRLAHRSDTPDIESE